MVVVDLLPDDGSVASVANGTPSLYTFITSADTNDLKVLKSYQAGYYQAAPAIAVKGPDPLETLSIPVLDRPSVLFADEACRPPVGA